MYTRRDFVRITSMTAGGILLASTVSLPARATSIWPPDPINSNDDPYGSGTFHSNGTTYTITYVDVVNAAINPTDPHNTAGPAQVIVTGRVGGTYYYSNGLFSDGWTGTDKGAQSKLWRIGCVIALAGGISAKEDLPASDSSTGIGSMFFRFKITAATPPSNNMNVTVRFAQGASNVEATAYACPDYDSVAQSYYDTGSATATGAYPVGAITATATPEYDPNHPNRLGYPFPHNEDFRDSGPVRASDFFTQPNLINGVGYILVGIAPPSPTASVTQNDPPPSQLNASASAESITEIVPIQVVGP